MNTQKIKYFSWNNKKHIRNSTYFQHPVWFLHQKSTTVIQTHWAAVQKPLTAERHGSLTLTQTNSTQSVSVCNILSDKKKTDKNRRTQIYKCMFLLLINIHLEFKLYSFSVAINLNKNGDIWKETQFKHINTKSKWSLKCCDQYCDGVIDGLLISMMRVIQVPVGVSQSISIESHFASAAACSSALGEFIVLRVEDWMTDSCPSSQQKPEKSSSSQTWLWCASSSGLSSAAASQVKSRESNSSPLWTCVPLKWSPQKHDAALCFCVCILRVQRSGHSDSAWSTELCSGSLRLHHMSHQSESLWWELFILVPTERWRSS